MLFSRLVSRGTAIFVAVIALVSLAGWTLGIPTLITVFTGLASMKVNTALCFLLSAAALWIATLPAFRGQDKIGKGLAVVVGTIGVATLAEHIAGVNLGIDQFLFVDHYTAPAKMPGRMSAITAVCFILFATARYIIDRAGKTAEAVISTATATGLFIVFVTLVGYAYGDSLLHRFSSATSIAVHTAVGFGALFIGLVMARPDDGWVRVFGSQGAGRVFIRRLLPVAVIFVPVLGWVRLQGEFAGFYGTRTGATLFAAANTVVLVATLFFANRQADRLDRARAESQKTLWQIQTRYQKMIEALRELVLIDDGEKIIYVNPFALQMMAAGSGAAIVGRPLASLIHPEDRDRALADLQKTLDTPDIAQTAEFRMQRTDGSDVLVEARRVPFDESGDAKTMIIAADVTAARMAERQVREAQKLEAVGQLTGGIAHDFNNLLSIVQVNGEFLFEDLAADTKSHRYAGIILEAVGRGAELVRRLLAFSRQQELNPKVVNLSDIIGSFSKLLRRAIPENIELRTTVGPNVPMVKIDPGMFENALLNLAVNARDAMPDGGTITVEVRLETLDAEYCRQNPGVSPGAYVLTSVSDTGTGISPENLKRIFEPFFTTKEVGKGTGLGLSMVYGFVRQSGGHAKVYSELGHGTCIKIYLPPSEQVKVQEAAPTDEHPANGHLRCSVLLVEDNEPLREATTALLEGLGCQVTPTTDATTALTLLDRTAHFDLVFSDMIMPGTMNGADLAREVHKCWPDTKMMLMSGYTATATFEKMGIPADVKLLQKPFSKAVLAEALARMFPQGTSERQLGRELPPKVDDVHRRANAVPSL